MSAPRSERVRHVATDELQSDARTAAALLSAVGDVRRRLTWSLLGHEFLVGIGAGAATWLAFSLTARAVHAELGWPVGLAFAMILAVSVAWWMRSQRGRMSNVRAALWIEEHTPLDFALVTAVEQAPALPPLWTVATHARVERAIASARVQVSLSSWRRLRGPLVFAIGAIALLAYGAQREFGAATQAGSQREASITSRQPAPIGVWRVRVTPPPYTREPARDVGDASTIRALSGSIIEIQGTGELPDSARARSLRDTLTAASGASSEALTLSTLISARDGGWSVRSNAADGPSELRVTRGTFARLLLVDGVADSIPRVTLERPTRDSVLRRAEGVLPLSARLHDDLGLSSAAFELVVSSGEGEKFTVKARQVGARVLPRDRDATLTASVDLAALQLGPGDVVHIRAIARDAHPLATHEAGTSETRSFRVARASEYDSVAVEPAPPPEVDKSLLSQRMLLLLTQKLDARRRSMKPLAYSDESRNLARDQARLREAVGDAVFQRLSGEGGGEHSHAPGDGHDLGVENIGGKLALSGVNAEGMLEEGEDSPVIAINKPLLEAYNAMWDAGRALEQSDTHAAIPFMRVALEAIERARAAQRLYLRGRPPTVIIDLNKVRMVGKDTGAVNTRDAREVLPPRAAQRESRLLRAAALATTDPLAARDSLAVMRLESLSDAPTFADALSALLGEFAGGKPTDVTSGFIRARRALGGISRLPLSSWTRGGPP